MSRRGLGQREPARIAAAGAIGDEGDGFDLADIRAQPQPSRRVGTGDHLAIPEDPELALDLRRLDSQRHAGARAAALERERQARVLGAAAAEGVPEAEAAVPAAARAARVSTWWKAGFHISEP